MRPWRNLVAMACLGAVVLAAGELGTETEAGYPRVPFAVGEKLTYAIRYGFIKAGEATMEVKDLVEYGPARCYHVVSAAKSTGAFSLFFEVRDSVSSLMDADSLWTRRYEKNLKEGNYTKREVVLFDQEAGTATYPDSSVIEIPRGVQDVLTSLYYIRTRTLEVGKAVAIENHADRKNYTLEVRVLRTEQVSVPAGRFDCFVVEPIFKASGLFQHQGRLTVWLTRDPRMLPVKMSGKIVVGSIEAVLSEMDPGGTTEVGDGQ
jgi:hypothetical protein